LRINTHDVIVSNIRSRPGPGGEPDGIFLGGSARDVVLDHVSISWGVDETLDIYDTARDVTVQWSIISVVLNCSTHCEVCHSKGVRMGGAGGGNVSFHHNLLAHNVRRNPRINDGEHYDVVNNVIYNASGSVVSSGLGGGKPIEVNYVGNTFLSGITSYFIGVKDDAAHEIYISGNNTPGSDEVKPGDAEYVVSTRHDFPSVTTTSASQARVEVLEKAGARLALNCDGSFRVRRDAIDTRIVNDVQNNTGDVIDDPSQVGGLPSQGSGAPCDDSDHDGMPNLWENLHGLDSANSGDRSGDSNGDGMTNLDAYLQGRTP